GGSYPFIQTGDVKHAGLYLTEYSQTYSDAGLAQSKLWIAGTLCITIAANIADTSILAIDACFPDSVIGFIPDPEKADARFIKYLFDAQLKLSYKQFTQGAAQDNLSQGKLLSLKFLVPEDVKEQKRIADYIAIYDDLIANNRRRIQLLEDSARLLYQEWFVHLRFPGHEHVKIDDGVPEGWDKVPISQICIDIKDVVKPEDTEGNTPYIGLEHIPRRSITLNAWETAEKVTSNKYRFKSGDIIFGKIRPYFHKIGFALCDGITSSDAIVIRPTAEKYYFLSLMYLSSDYFISLASKTVKEGSKMPRADWGYLLTTKVVLPPEPLLSIFDEQISKITAQLKILAIQNQALEKARDLLLPRLMNGTISV
ncbi:MAG: restriction endonuclease subunit S, partial [Methylobacter sp.]|nr:restriction endonuclease subunit S [Methylobacter sp.]